MIARSRASHARAVSGPGAVCASPLPGLVLAGALAAVVVAEPVELDTQPDQVI